MTQPPTSLKKALALSTLFWGSSAILQRASGLLGMHAGRPFPLTVAWGFFSTTCSLMIAQYGARYSPEMLPDGAWDTSSSNNLPDLWRQLTTSTKDKNRQEALYQSILGAISYVTLERRGFRTAIPSSVITTGVYAHTPLHWRWSRLRKDIVVASSEVATAAERGRIQKLGRLHGCHQCGSRQLAGMRPFIADHMPPTKVVSKLNAESWRRVLRLPAKQQLLPQCQSCFSVQGAAVKQGLHRAVYHLQFRVWHLAPVLALVIADSALVRDALFPAALEVDSWITRQRRALEKHLDDLGWA